MKNLIFQLFAALFLSLLAPVPTQAQGAVSTDFFYQALDPHGNWLEAGEYGYVWQPKDVPPHWTPYTNGRWVHTDAGWTWDSPEPYAWAVYHYGRWADVEGTGWVWVPDTEWGPAWVSWRSGPRYTGWAPLPPEARFRESVGFREWVDDYYDIGPRSYRFVDNRDFGAPNLDEVLIDPRHNLRLTDRTSNVTDIRFVDERIYNGGPNLEEVSRFTEQPVRRYRLERRQQFEGNVREARPEQLRPVEVGDLLRVFAVPFTARAADAASPPPRLSKRLEKTTVNRGWKDVGSIAEVESLRARIKEKSKDKPKRPEELPQQPKFDKSANDAPRIRLERSSANKRDEPRPERPSNNTPGPERSGRSPQTTPPASEPRVVPPMPPSGNLNPGQGNPAERKSKDNRNVEEARSDKDKDKDNDKEKDKDNDKEKDKDKDRDKDKAASSPGRADRPENREKSSKSSQKERERPNAAPAPAPAGSPTPAPAPQPGPPGIPAPPATPPNVSPQPPPSVPGAMPPAGGPGIKPKKDKDKDGDKDKDKDKDSDKEKKKDKKKSD